MSRAPWRLIRVTIGVGLLAVLVWRLGTRPFVEGMRTLDGWMLAAALGITVVTTVCSAWRWTLVSGGLGMRLPLSSAVGAYYRALFLNCVLPGGVLGDLHRGLRHGSATGEPGRALRAVVLERSAGQVLQVTATLLALLLLPWSLGSAGTLLAGLGVAALTTTTLLGAVLALRRHRLPVLRAAGSDLRRGLLQRRLWPKVAVASAVAVAGHTGTFLIAARGAGITAPTAVLVPLALLVLVAMGVPVNIAGWGPREGAAAWVFALAGQGAERGVAAAIAYGVMVLVAVLPGAVLLFVDCLPAHPRPRTREAGTSAAAGRRAS